MTTYNPDTLTQDHRVLRHIVREFGGTIALDTSVIRGGPISVGDAIEFVKEDESFYGAEQHVRGSS